MLMDGFYVSVPTSSYASTSTQDIILYCVLNNWWNHELNSQNHVKPLKYWVNDSSVYTL